MKKRWASKSHNYNNGYSQKRMPIYYDNGNNSNYGNSYNSYRGGNGGYSRRSRGYSYNDSKSHMIEKLNHLMMEASDQQDKDAIQRLIDQMQR